MTSAELTLAEMAPGGEAVGRRADGLVVFVPGGAPGDRVEVAIGPTRKGYAQGRLVRVLEPGAERVEPACPLALPERCGGCPLMAVRRDGELQAKERWVGRALRKLAVAIQPILSPTPELGYRLRARLVVRDGRLGFAGARSHRGEAIATCPVLAPALDQILFSGPGSVAGLAPLLGEGATVHGLLGALDGRPAVQLAVAPGRGGRPGPVRAALQAMLESGRIVGVRSPEPALCLGDSPTVELGGEAEWGPFFGAADGFAQPSAPGHTLLPRMVAEAVAAVAADGEPILELFAGSGNLSRALASRGRGPLHLVEGDAAAARRAGRLFAGREAITIEASPVESTVRALAGRGARFAAVVLDPPRAGARECLAYLPALGPRRIVYVSCDPMTLGRDLGELGARGYRPTGVQPIDLMPRTAHVETVAILDRV